MSKLHEAVQREEKKLISELIKAKSEESCLSKRPLSRVPGGSRHFQNFITVRFFYLFFFGGGAARVFWHFNAKQI